MDLAELIPYYFCSGAGLNLTEHICVERLKQDVLSNIIQAPRAWYQRFADFAASIGFNHSKLDTSFFIYRHDHDTAYILLYVDDIVLTASSESLRKYVISQLSTEFAMKDLGPLSYFLGIAVTRHKICLFLSQTKYAHDIIKKAGMTDCNPASTPVDSKGKMSTQSGISYGDPTSYRSLCGALQYLTFTRLDISYAVQQVCLFMHAPQVSHMNALKRIIRYIQGTTDYGLQLYKSSITSLISYTDDD
ncbi:uncharacterized mitochondrial protein AtMg00810-like [Impatiens glandulifera]|uniref:uncharacterized mitochondrial protein AtMg00810-like n=1 Tax=Impatiens glandulifera TaxID=253017 RepID=UPI001FB09E6C|nr:uncharacterized mitochondrial protein AtMg00810-like [Impatiens glandulifera]